MMKSTETREIVPTSSGGLGGRPENWPADGLTNRDAKILLQVARCPDWEMPAGFEKILPAMLWEIAASKKPDGNYKFSTRLRLAAIAGLAEMHRQNVTASPETILHVERRIDAAELEREIRRVIQGDTRFQEWLEERRLSGRDR